MSLIRLNNIHKSYGEAPDKPAPVLREVYFKLDRGDRVGLIGKNGAGKTTVLKLILGLETPSEGTVEIDDGVNIGYFSQFSQLDGTRSITEVLDDLFVESMPLKKLCSTSISPLRRTPKARHWTAYKWRGSRP